jgi:hypothetical protein
MPLNDIFGQPNMYDRKEKAGTTCGQLVRGHPLNIALSRHFGQGQPSMGDGGITGGSMLVPSAERASHRRLMALAT